jgi:hypothetical protein
MLGVAASPTPINLPSQLPSNVCWCRSTPTSWHCINPASHTLGIAWCPEQKNTIGQLVQALLLLHGVLDRDTMKNHVEYL